ncbi:hypothetical protein VII00023_06127 [Vibrio ichthyoenteri ATCC 700023]|uniref:Integrative conjugative element protein, RAQPRD family n=1 Tax=Vibrio ichthyoenteri ATCC 700023 TaxID=870968 RepID=F9S1U4_9VIBR|nr:RAQPRD family integrative conjugative element protein [Vibrio ichthyoenteri]EGU41184.1 hypothetical protein VII00023_06127 [Vibrio ichthyoenteri ATCC 700023]
MKSIIVLGVALLASLPVNASVEGEKQELALIQAHLDKLDYLIARAEREADYRSLRQFEYGALKSDIRQIQAGIDDYLHPERAVPRPVTPLGGDYVQRPMP